LTAAAAAAAAAAAGKFGCVFVTNWRGKMRGAVAIEYAFVLPVLLLFLLGILECGRLYWTYTTLYHAAEAAARCGAVNATLCATTSQTQSYAAAQAYGLTVSASAFTAATAACGMLPVVKAALAAISRSRSWDIATRLAGAGVLTFPAAAAFAAVVATARQLAAGGTVPRLLPTLVVNVCVVALLLIETTLIVCRTRAVAKTPGVKARASALVGTWLIFLVVFLPLRPDLPQPIYILAALLATGGDLLAIYVVLHLGGSYSIMAEARKPVSGGPYALVRHPLYVAEQIALLGALITYLSWRALVLFAVQSSVQYLRARNEEIILARAFPGYADYMRRTPMLLPRWDIGRGPAR
jgi:protein-S-isoprenylcysteine O-methyltransferase Ste14